MTDEGTSPCRDKIVAHIDPENIASGKLVEKVGFQAGDVIKNGYKRNDGQGGRVDRDFVQWYLLRPEVTSPAKALAI